MPKSDTKMTVTIEHVLRHLRERVISGSLSPGEQIRQTQTAQEIGVSRVPLREAMNLLADQGLLLHRPNVGYFVAKRTLHELAQLRRVLKFLEDELLRSIEWPGPKQIEALRDLNQQMNRYACALDWTPLVHLNRRFHLAFYELSTERFLLEEVGRLWALADSQIAIAMRQPDARVQTIQEHELLIESLACRDMPQLLLRMDQHRVSTAGRQH